MDRHPKKPDINLAIVGLTALIDEATGYQDVRDPKELRNLLKKLDSKSESPTNVNP